MTVPSTPRASQSTPPLAWFKPKDGDTTANWVCLEAIVIPTGVHLPCDAIEVCVVVRVSDLRRYEFLVAELAFRVCLEVVIPLRVFWLPIV